MKILVFDYFDTMSIQKKLLEEGNILYLCTNGSLLTKPIYEYGPDIAFGDRITKVGCKESVEKALDDCDFVLYVGDKPQIPLMRYLNKIFRRSKKPVLNYAFMSNCFDFEKKRAYAKQFDLGFDKYNIFTCKSYEEFKSLNLNKLYVIKAANEFSSAIKSQFRTIIPKSLELMDEILKKDSYGHFKSGGVILEEYIEGTEIEFGFYWNGNDIVGDILIDQEYKGVWNGNLGNVLCGESGTTGRFTKYDELKPKFKNIVDKCKEHFRTYFSKYKGFIGLNTISTKDFKKTYLMEYTVRCGCPTEQEVCYVVKNYTNFLKALAFNTEYKDGYKTKKGVYVAVAKYPYGFPITYMQPGAIIPVIGKLDKNVLVDMGFEKDGETYFMNQGRPLLSIGIGKTVDEANKKALKSLNKLDCWNLVHRTDIGNRWEKIYRSLLK